jgi:hypothetical protein
VARSWGEKASWRIVSSKQLAVSSKQIRQRLPLITAHCLLLTGACSSHFRGFMLSPFAAQRSPNQDQ